LHKLPKTEEKSETLPLVHSLEAKQRSLTSCLNWYKMKLQCQKCNMV